MDLTHQLLDIVKESLWYFRFIICLLIVISFLRLALTSWINYKIQKLNSKTVYQVVFDGQHRAINLTTSDKIEFEKLERHLLQSQLLIGEQEKNKEEKSAS